MTEISSIISQTGVNLEAKAFKTFGAAVANLAGPGLLSSIFGADAPGSNASHFIGTHPTKPAVWDPTPYASAFASGAGGFDPKTKFLFKVSFQFTPDVAAELSKLFGVANVNQFASNLTFVLKQIDLPRYKFEYEEVNMYNFRTQVLKRIIHDELNFQMYDTTGNYALNFVNTYLQLLMPLTRQPYTTGFALEDHGFAFTNSPADGNDTGSRAVLGTIGLAKNILSTMTIDQYYLSRDKSAGLKGPNIVHAIKANSYVFTNPRLTHFEITDQDHEKGSEPAMVSCGFSYDALYLRTGLSGVDVAATSPSITNDMLSNVIPAGASIYRTPAVGGGGFGNPFLNIIASAGSRTIQAAGRNILAKAGLANSGGYGSLLIGRAASALGLQTQRTLTSVGSNFPGISIPKIPILSDNSSSAQASTNLSSQISSSLNSIINS